MADGYTEADRRMVADVHHRLTCQGCVSGRGGCAGVDEADEEYADASLAALAGAGRLRPQDAVEDATAVFWTAVDRALGGRDDFPDSLPPGLQAAMQAGVDALAARLLPPPATGECGCPIVPLRSLRHRPDCAVKPPLPVLDIPEEDL